MLKIGGLNNVKQAKGWYLCPNCGQKLLKYDEKEAKSKKVYIKCKKCNKEIEINIE